jgi:hypothetical protein
MGIGPLTQGGLDKALSFAVGARGVRTSALMAKAELLHQTAKDAGLVAGAVVGKQAAYGDAKASVVSQSGGQEGGSRVAFLVGQNLGEGDARVIVDGDVEVLPADAFDVLAAIAVNAMTDTADATEFFDVEVEQIAGTGILIAHDGRGGFEIAPAVEMQAAQNAADGGGTERQMGGDALTGPTLPAELFDLADLLAAGGEAQPMRSRTAILQSVAAPEAVAEDPLAGGFDADFELGCTEFKVLPCWRTDLASCSRLCSVSRAFL